MSTRIPIEIALQQEQDRGRAQQHDPRLPITLMAFSNAWMLISMLIAASVFLAIIAIVILLRT